MVDRSVMTPNELARADRDEPFLKDLAEAILRMGDAFKCHHSEPPKRIDVPYETAMRLRMMNRDRTFVTRDYRKAGDGYCATICGVDFYMAERP